MCFRNRMMKFSCGVAAVLLAISLPVVADDGKAEALRKEIAAARLESDRAAAKLVMLEARQALLDGKSAKARTGAERALKMLRTLPQDDTTTDQMLICEGILARVASGNVPTLSDIPEMTPVAAGQAPPTVQPQARPSVEPRANVEPRGQRVPRSDGIGELANPGMTRGEQDRALWDWDEARRQQQAALNDEIKKDEVRMLDAADQARQVPNGIMNFPADWPEKARRREAQFGGGLVAKSDSWVDASGEEWFMGVYDIHDLIYMPPDFVPPGSLNPFEQQRLTLDREALRYNSFIFRGWPEDLAAGIPLLRYFGGVDDLVYRGPKYSVEKQRQIEAMVQMLLDDSGQPALISLEPVQQRP